MLLNHILGPVDTGLELLAVLRRAGLPEWTCTVLYSSAMSRELRKQALAAGFDDTIHTDEITSFALREMLARLVEQKLPSASSPS